MHKQVVLETFMMYALAVVVIQMFFFFRLFINLFYVYVLF